MKIFSPMPRGNGAFLVHKKLSESIDNYSLKDYSPWLSLIPPLISLQNQSCDLIHTSPDYGFFSLKKGTPSVMTFHNFVLDDFMSKYSSIFQSFHYKTDLLSFTKQSVKRASVLTAVSHFTAELAQKTLSITDPIRVIQNGVDLSRFYPKSRKYNKKFRILFCGNTTRRKGFGWFLEISRCLPNNIEIICASGLRRSAHHKSIPTIKFLDGFLPVDMPDLYRSVDLLVMPTVREGFSLSVLEAMASGLPVVATNCSSLPEQIINGSGGYLCDMGDVAQFVDAILSLAADASLCRIMGEYNRSRAMELFCELKMIKNYQELFSELL